MENIETIYFRIDRIVRMFGSSSAGKFGCQRFYPESAVLQRLQQEIARLITEPISKKLSSENQESIYNTHKILIGSKFESLCIQEKDGQIIPGFLLTIFGLAKFLIYWVLILVKFIVTRSQFGSPPFQSVFIYGVGDKEINNNGSSSNFQRYCEMNLPRWMDVNPDIFFISYANQPRLSSCGRFFYSKEPVIELFAGMRYSMSEKLEFICEHLKLLFNYFYAVFRMPILCLLYKDFVFYSAANVLNKKKALSCIALTNSTWLQQFLWQTSLKDRYFTVEMTMYSVNIFHVVTKSNKILGTYPPLRHLNVDFIWIWEESYEKTLRKNKILCPIKITDPILWYSKSVTSFERDTSVITVAVFDVTPFTDEFIKKVYGTDFSYLYKSSYVRQFLNDIIKIIDNVSLELGCEVRIFLKPKRAHLSIHDKEYLTYLYSLRENQKLITFMPADSNIYDLVNQADIVISIPFTSVACIAAKQGIPSIFYDPLSDIIEKPYETKNVDLVQGLDNLYKHVRSQIIQIIGN